MRALTPMTDNKKSAPQSANPGETDPDTYQTTTTTSEYNGNGRQPASAEDFGPEISFLRKLVKLGVALWLAPATQPGEPDHGYAEFHRPFGWQQNQPEALERIFAGWRSPTDLFPYTPAICANMGGAVVVVDVDPRNGGDIEKVRNLLDELKVRIFAELATPSGGRHLYIAGHEDLPTVHSTTKNNRLPGYPGVDIQSDNTNVFLPGTRRWKKYGGRGYTIEFDDLDGLINDGDPEGAERFADWVADQRASHIRGSAKGRERAEFVFDPAPQWDETPPDERQQKYLDAVLTDEAKKVSEAKVGGRNDALNVAALKCGHYISGAGVNQDKVIDALMGAARQNGLADGEDGERSAKATIRSGLRAGKKTPRSVPPPPDKMSHEEFWEKTDTLRHVRDFAHARRVGPWGLLGVSLARVGAVIPPTVQLPPLVGDNASLNLFIGLVAESGHGKGVVEKAAKAAFRFGPIYTTGVGSGEGINHLFAHYDKASQATVMDRWSVLFSVPEIDTLTALGNRNGTTLLPQLRKAWSGEALTFGYVDRTKALVIEEHAYRLSLVAGIQPGRAKVLIEDSDGGTPQRFVWLPTLDPEAPDEPPPTPEPVDLRDIASGWPGGSDLRASLTAAMNGQGVRPHVFRLPPEAEKLIDDDAKAKLRGQSTNPALDGHLGLCRIKVAAALALLHNEREITSLMWDLSGVVMEVSQATRAGIEKHLAEQGDKANRARGRAEGVRAVVSEEVREDATVKRVGRRIVHVLEKLGGKATRSDVRNKIASRDREDYFDDALDAQIAAGTVETIDVERGTIIRLTGRDGR
jgi:hypothetical protein